MSFGAGQVIATLFSTTSWVRLSFEGNGRARERRHGARSGLSKRNRLRGSQFVSTYVDCEQGHAFDIPSDTYLRIPCTCTVQNTSGLLILFVPNTCPCSRCWYLAIGCSETPFDLCSWFYFGQTTLRTLPYLQVLGFWAYELQSHIWIQCGGKQKLLHISGTLKFWEFLSRMTSKRLSAFIKNILGLVNFWIFLYTSCTIEVPQL
jgi:hypothetical protein